MHHSTSALCSIVRNAASAAGTRSEGIGRQRLELQRLAIAAASDAHLACPAARRTASCRGMARIGLDTLHQRDNIGLGAPSSQLANVFAIEHQSADDAATGQVGSPRTRDDVLTTSKRSLDMSNVAAAVRGSRRHLSSHD